MREEEESREEPYNIITETALRVGRANTVRSPEIWLLHT